MWYGQIAPESQADLTTLVVQSADPDDLAARTNAAIAEALQGDRVIVGLTLAGAGDGHTFTVTVHSVLPADLVSGGLDLAGIPEVACRLASSAEELQAAIRDSLLSARPTADVQVAGAAKGTRFMSMNVYGLYRIPVVPVLTQWTAYQPVLSGGTSAIGDGLLQGQWRQVGDTLELQIYLQFGSTTQFDGAESPQFSLPPGFVIDESKTVGNGQLGANVALKHNATSTTLFAIPRTDGPSTIMVAWNIDESLLANVPWEWAIDDQIYIFASVPIQLPG